MTESSYYFSRCYHIWGWASWARAWAHYDVEMRRWPQVRDTAWLRDLLGNEVHARIAHEIFERTYRGEPGTWDFQWAFAGWMADGLSVIPRTNLVSNLGHGPQATHQHNPSLVAKLPRETMSFPLRHPPQVSALQAADDGRLKTAATVKHFAGYSESINGHDRVEAQLPIRYLQDVFLPSYAGAINADAATVMVDSGSINNIPATASHFLLTTELRERLGFKGVVISDYGDVPALASAYHVAADFPGAIAKAVNAGVDVSMTPFDYAGWNAGLVQDVQRGLVSVDRINASVRRILRLKFALGL